MKRIATVDKTIKVAVQNGESQELLWESSFNCLVRLLLDVWRGVFWLEVFSRRLLLFLKLFEGVLLSSDDPSSSHSRVVLTVPGSLLIFFLDECDCDSGVFLLIIET